ncbi:MAG: S9 family peptidase [Bacteroidales bacterium]|nr:S9 family peptidase [Bacteroidales bacterium]
MKKSSIIFTAMAMTTVLSGRSGERLQYPAAPADPATDRYFDITVTDTYRPLENDTAAATLQWVEAERSLTEQYLSKIPFRDKLRSHIASFQNYNKTGLPWKSYDNKYYFYENSGMKNQSVLYRKDTLDGKPEVFLDPNTLSDDGTVALTGVYMSPDGRYTAYTISRSGSDWSEIYLLDTATGQLLPDHIEWAKFTGAEWYGDGFFYSAYPVPEAGKEFSNANENHRIYYHKIGTPQSEDKVFYEDTEHPLYFHSLHIPHGSHYAFLMAGGQGFGEAIKVKDLSNPASEWIVMEPSQDNIINIIDLIGDTIYFTTSVDAPNYRLMSAPVTAPSRENWREIIPETDAVLAGAQMAGDKLIVTYQRDASSHPALYDLDGNLIREIQLPGIASASFSSSRRHDEVFYNVSNYLQPWAHYSYNTATGESTLTERAEVPGFNPDDYVTEEVFYPSTDGTMVHMHLTYRKDLKRDGTNPVYLYGYGGFNVPLGPGFSPNRLNWLANGGIYAEANLRGGSEYGDKWHEAGTKLQKKNVFNDFISAAEYMIKEGWTTPERLVIEGGSNGGLLVGACVNMRPDLFAVAIPRVGVMDMLRYHLFTIGWNWASDYGTSADSPEMAAYLRSYSPMHNIKNDGTPYPAILVTTADHDDRVVPAHSFKYAAELQAANTGDKPKLIRIDSKAGHGAGKPISKVIDEYADLYSFIYYNLGIVPVTE